MSTFAMKRTASMCSLPSPPADHGMDLSSDDEDRDRVRDRPDVMNLASDSRRPCKRRATSLFAQDADQDEVDELESDDGSAGRRREPPAPDRRASLSKRTTARGPIALGSPVNVSTSSSTTTRKQLLNPFFLSTSSRPSSTVACPSQPPAAADLSSSPEQQQHVSPMRRRRLDRDRIKFDTTPPQKSRLQLQLEREQEARSTATKDDERMRWDDPDNPFLDRNDDMFKRVQDRAKSERKRPQTLTYVKRGERIQTSIPFTAVLTSSCPSEDPFTYTTPKLLFPPAAPRVPATPPSSFLQALRASTLPSAAHPTQKSVATAAATTIGGGKPGATDPAGGGGPVNATEFLPPTPVTMKRTSKRNPEAIAAAHSRNGMRQ